MYRIPQELAQPTCHLEATKASQAGTTLSNPCALGHLAQTNKVASHQDQHQQQVSELTRVRDNSKAQSPVVAEGVEVKVKGMAKGMAAKGMAAKVMAATIIPATVTDKIKRKRRKTKTETRIKTNHKLQMEAMSKGTAAPTDNKMAAWLVLV